MGNIAPNTIGTSTSSSGYGALAGVIRCSFRAAGLFWVFYSPAQSNLSYRTSPTGLAGSWSLPTLVTTKVTAPGGYPWDVWWDGTYGYYVSSNNIGVYFRRFTPQAGGTLLYSQVEQLAVNQASLGMVQVRIDSGGYPWIGYYDGVGFAAYVTKSSTNDGTWATAAGFPYLLGASNAEKATLIPLTGGKMYATYGRNNIILKGKLYNAGWGAAENVSTSNVENNYPVSAVAIGDVIHLVYYVHTSYNLVYVKRPAAGPWSGETVFQAGNANQIMPSITRCADGSLRVIWASNPTTDHIYFKKLSGGIFDAAPTQIADESVDHIITQAGPSYYCCASYQDDGNFIPINYGTHSVTPTNVRFMALGSKLGLPASGSMAAKLMAAGVI